MAVSLSIKQVPDALAARLRVRATQNHRSMQGELLAILYAALEPVEVLSVDSLWEMGAKLESINVSESTAIVRQMRDDGHSN